MPIHALTPQAKGRVERANQTLQDRLVKEMRLQGGINSIEAANDFAVAFRARWNMKFAVPPRDATSALGLGPRPQRLWTMISPATRHGCCPKR